jgi:hypothetical protein
MGLFCQGLGLPLHVVVRQVTSATESLRVVDLVEVDASCGHFLLSLSIKLLLLSLILVAA